jgi:hypothetical protein
MTWYREFGLLINAGISLAVEKLSTFMEDLAARTYYKASLTILKAAVKEIEKGR